MGAATHAKNLGKKYRPMYLRTFIYQLPQTGSTSNFNTTVDIKLKQWAEQALPAKSVETGWETLQVEFEQFMKKAQQLPDHDGIFDNLKAAVVDEAMRRHSWEDKASEMLRIIQLNTLEDRSVSSKAEWDEAIKFLESAVRDRLAHNELRLREMLGPGTKERWLRWEIQHLNRL
ncbi:dynamin-like 120 kDa protein, mitochondrial [Ctenocephalides felis]|uniref:dynamin-like 120 kDa protein, mitochondrial n=1 Tax=Ctenocephalides felis TaxID=7515 RepID=UPI000E6E5AB5|nr:dynamin-like 120 kDa protein, mitochondrial [Ctenocephalides felis]